MERATLSSGGVVFSEKVTGLAGTDANHFVTKSQHDLKADRTSFETLQNKYLKHSFIAMPGQGTSDYGMTGLYDRDETAFADLRGTVTQSSNDGSYLTLLPYLFDGVPGNYTSGVNITNTSEIVVHIDMGIGQSNYGHAKWFPYLQYRIAPPGQSYFRSVTVEVSNDNITWYKPSSGWETSDFLTDASSELGGS